MEKPERQPISLEDSEILGCEARILLYGRRRGVFRNLYTVNGDTVWVSASDTVPVARSSHEAFGSPAGVRSVD